MTARAKKELRVLLPAWSVAILAAFTMPIVKALAGWTHRPHVGGFPLRSVEPLAGVCLVLACLAMAALSFGVEYHHRTFGLMLVQPARRSRIWWSKMLPLAGAYISVGAAFIAGRYLEYAAWGSPFKAWVDIRLLGVAVLLAGVLCSSAFWTLLSRSVIGGMVLPLAVQGLLAGVIAWFVSSTSAVPPGELESMLIPALGAGALVYCVLFMYLGWRKLSRLEWREGFLGESGISASPARRARMYQPAAARSSAAPGRAVTSLLRKEIRLHRPVFALAMLFVVCWLAALGLRALLPSAWNVHFREVFAGIMVIYLPLAWLLSGCISMGEEKQLGTWGWHMTLPVSGAHQWAVKISFMLLVALILGFLLPALAWPAAGISNILKPAEWWVVDSHVLLALLAAVCCTVLSFWSVIMFGSVVRAVLFTFLGALVLLAGGSMMSSIGRETGLLQGFFSWLIVTFQLSINHGFFNSLSYMSYHEIGSFIGLALLMVSLLRQSYVHCRREPSRRVILRDSLILVLSLFLPLWLSSDILSSSGRVIWSLNRNLGEAVSKLPPSVKEDVVGIIAWPDSLKDGAEKAKPVSIEEIDGTGVLLPETRRWLRGATLKVIRPRFADNYAQIRSYVLVIVNFPDGRNFITSSPW
jgi:hypothetical protein